MNTCFFNINILYTSVEQEDLMFANLSVEETLSYAARLRLPDNMSQSEKMNKVNEIILQMNLDGARNTYIGDSMTRGVSGGEKKRVSIGLELVTDPEVSEKCVVCKNT